MWKRFSSDTHVLIQGMTGKEGMRMTKWLLGSGVRVVAGVTPGKGGQTVEGLPVFNSVGEAKAAFPDIEVTSIVVPPLRVLGAVEDALQNGIKYLQILTETIPVHDVLAMRQKAHAAGATILGPSSVGYLQFPKFRVGYIGGEEPFRLLKEGSVAVVSNSGGMTNELLMGLSRRGIGIRCAFAVGGDRVLGTSLGDALAHVDASPDVTAIAMFAEPGHPILQALASGAVTSKKPLAILMPGDVLDTLPRGTPYGHTGTVLGEDDRSVPEMRAAIREKGYICTGSLQELFEACEKMNK
ncbi:CoA-binding protein [Patescibacteria group bacterium]|nr:CoA-binding protein [Patescibacteria group bacterium]MBP9709725.1 CoA-binding protein [Patescibacteria group bacterium]